MTHARPSPIRFIVILCIFAFACAAPKGAAADPPGSQTGPGPKSMTQVSSAKNTVSMTILSQYKTIMTNSEGDLNVLVRLKGEGEVSEKRPPLDLALVIDRSGSMNGDKMRSVKDAALKLLSRLTPNDRVSLITYDDKVKIAATSIRGDAQGKAALREKIIRIYTGGSTALGPALKTTLGLLRKQERSSERMAHVLLLSDGLANVGEKNPLTIATWTSAAFADGISVSTLGVGTDYNEDLMTRIADSGGGRYHFIENDKAIAKVLSDEFTGLVSTVARSVELEICAGASCSTSSRFVRAFGYPTETKGDTAKVRIGALSAGQTRDILLRYHVKPKTNTWKNFSVGSIVVHFRDVTNEGQVEKLAGSLIVKTSDDPKKVKASEDTTVTIRVAEVENAERLNDAAMAVDNRDFEKADGILDGSVRQLRAQNEETPSANLRRQIKELESARSDLKKAKKSESARKGYSKSNKARVYSRMKK